MTFAYAICSTKNIFGHQKKYFDYFDDIDGFDEFDDYRHYILEYGPSGHTTWCWELLAFFDDFWQLLVNLRGLKHAPDNLWQNGTIKIFPYLKQSRRR